MIAALGLAACGTTSRTVVGDVTGAVAVGTAPAVVSGAVVAAATKFTKTMTDLSMARKVSSSVG
jgi:hypothetical protein